MELFKLNKIQLEDIINLKYSKTYLMRLAGGYGAAYHYKQCDCTEEEFLMYRKRAKEKMENIK